jgi:glycosyltransferase involved in cell wall biosynthesis
MALLEARVITGPAKNLLRFATDCRDRVDLTIVTFVRGANQTSNNVSENQFISAARSLGIRIELIRETGPFDLSVLTVLRQIFETNHPDIVQTHGVKSHFLVSLLTRRTFRWIAFHHGYTNEDFKARCYILFDRWSLRFCDLLVTVCTDFANILVRRGVRPEKIFVLPNSIKLDFLESDVALSKKTRQQCNISEGQYIVLSIGRLSTEKGFCFLIDATSRIVRALPQVNFHVLVTGDGPELTRLKERAHSQGLDQRITFTGHCSDTRGLYSIANLFVLPSLSEGSPNVLLESMAARVPIVATSVGGVPEILDNGESAILVSPGDSESLADAMIHLILNQPVAIQLANTAFEKVKSAFSTTRYDERLLNIYDNLAANQSP